MAEIAAVKLQDALQSHLSEISPSRSPRERAARKPRVMDVTDARTTRTTPLLDAAIEPPKARRLRLIVTVAVVTLGSSIQSGFATGVVRHAQLQSTHSSNPRTPSRLV